ncbi:cerebellin-3-like [Sardina pilchardus]|uniref:cerebellin-3-like n=1 Tax=Sardina pilchardus TaxID=27697 RepID=UPI002E0F2913
MGVWNKKDQPLWEQLSTLQKEMKRLSREQVILKQKQKAIDRMLIMDENVTSLTESGRHQLFPPQNFRSYRRAARKRHIHFFASHPGSLEGKVNRITFSKVLVNKGAGFKKKTSVFRAPVSGVYQFYFSSQSKGNATVLWLVIKNYWVAVARADVKTPASTLGTYMTTLCKNDKVYVNQVTGNNPGYHRQAFFCRNRHFEFGYE